VIKPESPIRKVEIKKSELTPEYVGQKGVRLDVVATADNDEIINVEVQRKDEKDMLGRTLFYWSELFCGQLKVGEKYKNLKRTISISVLDFNLFKNDDRYWRRGYLTDDFDKSKMTDLQEVHFVELNKVRKVDRESPLTFWIEFFQDPYSEKVWELCKFVPEISEAKEAFEKAKSDPEAMELIRMREKGIRDYANDVACAKEEGLAIGELKKAKEMAKNLLLAGVDVGTIAKASGLAIDEVERLRK
jgi:predicted transposase/invertase (TIGR01784 family)